MVALTCRFDPQQMSVWSNRTGVHFFTDAQRDEAYLLARPFLLEQMRILLEAGWKKSDRTGSDESLIDIYKPRTSNKGQKKRVINLTLPLTFDAFLDTPKAKAWRTMFENTDVFKAVNQSGNNLNHDLYIDSSRALANIFFFLQILAPGMLVINHEYQLSDVTVKVSKMLPRAHWIQKNFQTLNLTVTGGMDALLTAAKDQKAAFHEEKTAREQNDLPRSSPAAAATRTTTTTTPRHRNSRKKYNYSSRNSEARYVSDGMDDGTGYDWTACSKDSCAWCGRCQY
ncbi:hypothetical protein GALMADRAFT_229240 [Galerina marginata CBS 339.88]|uniref:Uncharacterized protein n=1 Tax=Galerina marginata (strain CBS 339.88) TaxID=685588 RepID=A0A067SZE6_GALM3|nr:hypothetical protein GALMADRAFT_229240 [Galerina marginata CBS 339.88]